MEELYSMGISENTIKYMLELNPNIKEITNKEVLDKVQALKTINKYKYRILKIYDIITS